MKKKEEAARTGKVIRTTMETVVDVQLNIDGEGTADIDTGIGFFDHMLNLLASHGRFDLKVKADGDLEVDGHHTVEDVGIALGQAMMDAAGSKKGIARYGSFFLPMDETLALVSLDFSGRPLLVYDAGGPMTPMIGDYDTELTEEFLRAFAVNAGLTLHVKLFYGTNSHHKVEAIFKGLGHALRIALTDDPRVEGVMSTKGVL
ncbi:MAG: imidazoleglycerol-phosphate dehydratase HisB [Schwartzia sp.]|nr:imidazoleglycerol-phosphate dehydratase HisB [Schwartzia sp. (in: firmicutes)]